MKRILRFFAKRNKGEELASSKTDAEKIDDLIDDKLNAWIFHFDRLNTAIRKKELYDEGCYHYEPGFSESSLKYRRDEMKRISAEIEALERERSDFE